MALKLSFQFYFPILDAFDLTNAPGAGAAENGKYIFFYNLSKILIWCCKKKCILVNVRKFLMVMK